MSSKDSEELKNQFKDQYHQVISINILLYLSRHIILEIASPKLTWNKENLELLLKTSSPEIDKRLEDSENNDWQVLKRFCTDDKLIKHVSQNF
jgi:hypothetical protein